MPYKLSEDGKTVLKQLPNGRWVAVKGGKHKTPEQAQKHLAALKINVPEAGGFWKKK